jgi:hypothetical protein
MDVLATHLAGGPIEDTVAWAVASLSGNLAALHARIELTATISAIEEIRVPAVANHPIVGQLVFLPQRERCVA